MLRNIILKVTRIQYSTLFSHQFSQPLEHIDVTPLCFTEENTGSLRCWMICPMTQNKWLKNWQLNPAWFQSRHPCSCSMMPFVIENQSWPVPTTSNSNQLLKKGELLSRKLPHRVSILVEKEMNASNSKLQLLGFLKWPKISRGALSFLGAKMCLRLKKSVV